MTQDIRGIRDAIDPIDGTISIVTPENITFDYHVAGPFQRAFAFLIDIGIRTAILFGLYILSLIIDYQLGGIGHAMFQVAQLIVIWMYGILFEIYMNGQTPGKRIVGLRSVTVDGKPMNAMQAVLRNMLRMADTFPLVAPAAFGVNWGNSPVFQLSFIPTFMVGLLVMSMNKRFQRLGDLVAGTMVIVDQKQPTQGLHDVRHPNVLHIASLLPANFKPDQGMSQALAHFIDQRNRLTQQRRDEIAKHLAEPLCKQLKLAPNINPDLLLQALYYRAFVSDAQNEVPLTAPLAAIAPTSPSGYAQSPYPQNMTQPITQPLAPQISPRQAPPSRPPTRGDIL
jgi:uncharacterized RDD family membrane protein YckC